MVRFLVNLLNKEIKVIYSEKDIIWDPNSTRAREAIGKDCFSGRTVQGAISSANENMLTRKLKTCGDTFTMNDGFNFQFIIVKQSPTYTPFDFSDPAVRRKLRGRWIRKKDGTYEKAICYFKKSSTGEWLASNLKATTLLNEWEFIDGLGEGAVCGELKRG